ncbi:MAG: DUF2203 domain-containing protein [Actinomycetota bacterium]
MAEKRYTPEEANSLLPYVAPTLVELREKFEDAVKIRELVAQAAATNGGSPQRDDWHETLSRVGQLLGRLDEWEIVLRDVSTGLIDFPTTIDGADAWLCWRLGEAEVAYWHSSEEGFSSRKPL